jgi:hypothetical protein
MRGKGVGNEGDQRYRGVYPVDGGPRGHDQYLVEADDLRNPVLSERIGEMANAVQRDEVIPEPDREPCSRQLVK